MINTPFSTRKILLSGMLGIVSLGAIATPGFAQEPKEIQKMGRSILHHQIGKAIAANDYEAFTAAIAGKAGAKVVTETQFHALVESASLRKEGKYTEAQDVLRNAGFTGRFEGKPNHHRSK